MSQAWLAIGVDAAGPRDDACGPGLAHQESRRTGARLSLAGLPGNSPALGVHAASGRRQAGASAEPLADRAPAPPRVAFLPSAAVGIEAAVRGWDAVFAAEPLPWKALAPSLDAPLVGAAGGAVGKGLVAATGGPIARVLGAGVVVVAIELWPGLADACPARAWLMTEIGPAGGSILPGLVLAIAADTGVRGARIQVTAAFGARRPRICDRERGVRPPGVRVRNRGVEPADVGADVGFRIASA